MFVTFEGIEGSGKSTQARALAEHLEDQIRQDVIDAAGVLVTKQPGGSPLGVKIRGLVLEPGCEIDPWCETFLMLADRAQHATSTVMPYLQDNWVVISDRYTHSGLAYQGYGHDLPTGFLRMMNRVATHGVVPDLTLVLDLEPEAGLARTTDPNRMERKPIEFHRKIREAYLDMAETDPYHLRVVDASRSASLIHDEIFKAVMDRMRQHGLH